MALGAITAVPVDPHNSQSSPVAVGDVKLTVTNIVGDGSYATGGSAVTPQQLGLTTVLATQSEAIATTGSNNAASSFYYNTATGKLQCFTTGATGAFNEVGAAVNLSGLTIQVLAFGY